MAKTYHIYRQADIEHIGDTADIDDPYHGQLVWLTGSRAYRYFTGTAWAALGGGGGGADLELLDEGSSVELSTTAIDVVGAGGTVTSTGAGSVELLIPGAIADTLANRPAAVLAPGGLYFATDNGVIYTSNGVIWTAAVISSAGLTAVGTAGTYGSATQVPVITTDVAGRVTGVTPTNIAIAQSQVTNLVADLAAKASQASLDSAIQGLAWKASVRAATTANITLSGAQTIDGVSITNERVLVKNQSTGGQNGIYDAAAGSWTRATDADTAAEILQAVVAVREGTANADAVFMNTTNAPITLDTTATVWSYYPSGTALSSLPAATVPIVGADTVPIVQSGVAGLASVDSIRDVDNWKRPVRVATTANGTLATAFANGQTVDGVTIATGNRLLLKNQSTIGENGIYTANATGAPTRATDFDDAVDTLGAAVPVLEGTLNASTVWRRIAGTTYSFRRFGGQTDIQVFTSDGTWTKPAGAVLVDVDMIAGGSGAGSGRVGAAGSDRFGGSGGASGGRRRPRFSASMLGATEAITVGVGGTGGAAVPGGTAADGNNGGAGSDSTFGTWSRASTAFAAGSRGTNTIQPNGTPGSFGSDTVGAVFLGSIFVTGFGGRSLVTATAEVGTHGITGALPGNGGGGGGVSAANVERAGGSGGDGYPGGYAGGTGGAARTAGGAATASASNSGGGAGGGGGGSNLNTVAGGAGSDGANYGAGGGGGGAGTSGGSAGSGKGGNGTPGIVIVQTLF